MIAAAGGNVAIAGADVTAANDNTLTALGSVSVSSVADETIDVTLGKDSLITTTTVTNTPSKLEATAGDLTVTAVLGNIDITASELKSGGTTTLDASLGGVNLKAALDSKLVQEEGEQDGLYIKVINRGSYDETVKHTTIDAGGGLTINSGPGGISVDYKDTGQGLDGAIDALSAQPGLAWMADVKTMPGVDWNAVQEAHESWDYSSEHLNPAVGAVIAIALTAVTAGAGGVWGTATLANGATVNLSLGQAVLGIKTGAALAAITPLQTAMIVGINTLAVSAGSNLAANKGDLGATLKGLASSSSLKSLAAAMITAGVLQGVSGPDGLNLPVNSQELVDKIYVGIKGVRVI